MAKLLMHSEMHACILAHLDNISPKIKDHCVSYTYESDAAGFEYVTVKLLVKQGTAQWIGPTPT